MLEKLRDEIVESQKVRTDFLKWKLFLVAAIGAAAFGIGSRDSQSQSPPLVLLGLIPFVCLYVDAVCIHNQMRILIIARFMRRGSLGQTAKAYEEYCRTQRSAWSLEDFALVGTTIFLSVLVLLVGIGDYLRGALSLPQSSQPLQVDFTVKLLLILGGLLGLVASPIFHVVYRRMSTNVDGAEATSSDREGAAGGTGPLTQVDAERDGGPAAIGPPPP